MWFRPNRVPNGSSSASWASLQQRQPGTSSASPMRISAATVGQINSGGYSGNMVVVSGTQSGDGGISGDGAT
jgi:hypothetical protein